MSVSGTARKALEAVQELGGQASSHTVSRRLRTDTGYARLLCLNLAREDHLNLKPSGLFRITRKGERALNGETSVSPLLPGKAGPGRNRTRQVLDWYAAPRGGHRRARPACFSKPGQEPLPWHAVKTDGTAPILAGGPGSAATVLDEGMWPCGFCRGKGQRPAGSKCPVCRGTGIISLSPPVARCAFCKGRGEEKVRSNVTCTVCRGKGYVEVADDATACARCNGTGREKNNKLPCLGCKGKGLVGERTRGTPEPHEHPDGLDFWQREQVRLKIKHAGPPQTRAASVAGTELEVLTAYCEAEEAGEAPDLARRTGLSDGYIGMLRQSLLGKGLLVSAGARRFCLSDAGREVIASARGRAKAVHGS